jgi:hypothetical protein
MFIALNLAACGTDDGGRKGNEKSEQTYDAADRMEAWRLAREGDGKWDF